MKKRLLSLFMTAAAVLCLGLPALAEEPAAPPAPPAPDVVEQQPTPPAPPAEKPELPAPPAEAPAPPAPPSLPAEEHRFTYVALGDSITAGTGLSDFQYLPAPIGLDVRPNFEGYSADCYVSVVAQRLGLDRQHALNLGLPGLMAPDLVDMVRDGAMPHMNQPSGAYYVYPEYQDYIRNADVISIQIGANDALVPVNRLGGQRHQLEERAAGQLHPGGRIPGSELGDDPAVLRQRKEAFPHLGRAGRPGLCLERWYAGDRPQRLPGCDQQSAFGHSGRIAS